MSSKVLKIAITAFLFAVSVFIAVYYDAEEMRSAIKQTGIYAPLIFILVCIIKPVFFFLPSMGLTIIAGILFGPVYGTIYVVIGGAGSTLTGFYFARWMGRDAIKRLLKNGKIFSLTEEWMQEKGKKAILAMRVFNLPWDLVSYWGGVTGVSFKDFYVASLIPLVPISFLYVYFGSTIFSPLSAGFIISLIVMLALGATPYIIKRYRGNPPLSPFTKEGFMGGKKIGCLSLPINRLHLELTNICNFSCEFCPDSKMKRQLGKMPLDMVKAILDDASSSGAVRLVLFHLMGEPTLYPHLTEAARHAKQKNIETCITTNGSLIDEKMLEELIDAGTSNIIVSLQTPDEKTFQLRGAKGLSFEQYAGAVTLTAERFQKDTGNTRLTISFLSSPLRRLIIPVAPEMSIADRSPDLRKHLLSWADRIMKNTPLQVNLERVKQQINRAWTFRENTINISRNISFHTRILGDWATHADNKKTLRARFGYCPGIQENFGILWNGDYVFCCTDFDGKTSTHNFNKTAIIDYLKSDEVQRTARGFRRLRIIHPHCQRCIGDRNLLNTLVRQIGSIFYFKFYKKTFN